MTWYQRPGINDLLVPICGFRFASFKKDAHRFVLLLALFLWRISSHVAFSSVSQAKVPALKRYPHACVTYKNCMDVMLSRMDEK